MSLLGRSKEEVLNTLTHLVGVLFTLSMAWLILKLSYEANWKHAFGVTFFTCGMLIMYACSTLYHWWKPGKGKRVLRLLDHIGIYIMIASSYTPICIGVVGGALGWVVFGLLWAVAIGGTFYKIFLLGRYPRLSLILYLMMGWSVVLIG
ncbi:MAG: hemolysin III family protein, partial [Bacteroides sp.]|nr:hemolysin III family protein [Bacteroides sp.]